MTICFATNNLHKLEEVRHAVAGEPINILSLSDINCFDELPETRDTLEGNSLQKAEYVFQHYNLPCFADDTGLEVEALSGSPGVYSARYAGDQRNSEDNITLLLKELQHKPNRRARFRTVITCIGLSDRPVNFEGVIDGEIVDARHGAGGFGYDPVFKPIGYDRTFAEMTLAEKNSLSHRARAVAQLIDYLQSLQTVQ
jgi:XTP/dITP diphosphohydrolase